MPLEQGRRMRGVAELSAKCVGAATFAIILFDRMIGPDCAVPAWLISWAAVKCRLYHTRR
jgi:hypothetical protein